MPDLSIIIPAYNEQSRLPDSLKEIFDYIIRQRWKTVEILIINDGSTDLTADIGRELASTLGIRDIGIQVIENPGNRGKGYSIRNGMRRAEGDWILFTDADLSAPIEELLTLWDAVQHSKADGAIGSRALDRSLIGVHQPPVRELAGRIFNGIVRLVTGLPFHDTQCGFKLFSHACAKKVFSKQQIDRFGFDVEVLFLAKRFGFKIVEVPVRWNHCEGTKVGALSGAGAFVDILRVRWNALLGRYRD